MVIRGIEDKKELGWDKLRELAFIDDLTSLYNRRYLYRYLPTELKDIERVGGTLSLFMMDVDTFKKINDTYGHLCGDRILIGIAQILRQCLRKGDTLVRYAGDEFIAILPETEKSVAVNIARNIIERIEKNPFKEAEAKGDIRVTMSIGLACFPADAFDPEELINQADQALYSAKRSGRNSICTTSDISAEALDETRLKQIFRCVQLIGREKQLAKLKKLLARLEKKESKLVLIKGEKGAGKTRLLSELSRLAKASGITSINATCSPEISTQPYQILISALANLFTSLGVPQLREFVRSLPEAQLIQLAHYIPALKTFLTPGLKDIKERLSEGSQLDLFKAICQSLIFIVKRNSLLLVIDDLHWIDKGTLELFNYIIKELHSIPILIAGAYQQEKAKERADEFSLQKFLDRMCADNLMDELILEPLEKEDLAKMITAIFTGIQISAKFMDIVYGGSAGNPLFIEEALRSLVNQGFIFYQNKTWQSKEITEETLPVFLKEAIQKRIAELDAETKPIILAASVIGEVFNFDILCHLVEKDPGYVLEAIDRAQKLHLIVPENPFQSDRFKFKSGIIRDAAYEDINVKEKQNLHRRLALIEEKTYKDNLDSVAGSLKFHFTKAQDTKKSSLYSKLLLEKARHLPSHEDLFNFLQESLLEKIEEIVVPLTAESMKLVPAMVRSLRLATQNVRLYPAHSAVRGGFVNQVYKYLTDILGSDSTVVVSTAENRLLINGEEMSERAAREAGADGFVACMVASRIKSINFKRGLTKEQLTILLEGLSQNYDDLISVGGLAGLLRKKEVSQIRVNEVRYEQTSKLTKQRTRVEEAMFIDYLIGKTTNLEKGKTGMLIEMVEDPRRLADTLSKIAEQAKVEDGEDKIQVQANTITKSLEKLNDQLLIKTKGSPEKYYKNIAGALVALDSKLRTEVLQTQVDSNKVRTDKTTAKDLVGDIIKGFNDEQILQIVSEEYKNSPGNLTNMYNLTRRFLQDPQRNQKLISKLEDRLHQLGLKEDEVSWMLKGNPWQGLSLEDKARRVLSLSPESFVKLQREISEDVDKLILEFLENGQYAKAGEIIDRLLEQLENQTREVRTVTIEVLQKVSDALILKEKYFLLEQIINSLIVELDKEKDSKVYFSVACALAGVSVKLLQRQNFIQATGILRELNLRIKGANKIPDAKRQLLQRVKNEIVAVPEIINQLTKLLKEKIEGRHEFWELSKAISEIGLAALKPIFYLAISKGLYSDPFQTYAFRWNIAKALKDMDDEALTFLKARLQDNSAESIRVALELLGHLQDKGVVKDLYPLLKHKDLDVRKDAITTLGKIGGNEAIKFLSESIKDKDTQIHLASLWALANIGGKQVLPLLEPLLEEPEFSEQVKKIIQRIEKK